MRGETPTFEYIDAHTAGEPTRVVIAGATELAMLTPKALVERLSNADDWIRASLIDEPRGHQAMVGAMLCQPANADCAAGVVFFNNTGYLGMCGHGAIGVAVVLGYLGKLVPGYHQLDTPVGTVGVNLIDSHQVEIKNVPSYRYRNDVTVRVDGIGEVTGDVAWGGNWFFLTQSCLLPLTTDNLAPLTDLSIRIQDALAQQGVTGANGAMIDHVEFFAPTETEDADCRNFVLCPGGAYDRSPCGTGTSAKLACLAAEGMLAPGEIWVQESIIGSRFVGTYELGTDGMILPTIRGSAYVCSEGRAVYQSDDPFACGLFHPGRPAGTAQ
ncbi:hydroxyproline-2-epimerase [Rhodopirellula sp. MGV]|nr:hydroxyproline-2-epimerase [Rhodopirellula sp. MGV]PNY38905.1 hydroxyproline-2-epimerase [Rhodopirellula baltica]